MPILRKIVRVLKKVPVDLGQYEMRYTTKGKMIAWQFVGDGTGKSALDLGCRDGYWAEKLALSGYDVTAVDLFPKYSKGAPFDANLAFPYPADSFDLVWCSEVIEHLKDPLFTIREIRRVLKPDGKLLLTTPNDGCWIFRLLKMLGVSSGMIENEEHEHFFTYLDIAKLLPGCEMYGYFPYLFYRRTIVRYSDVLSPTIVAVFCNQKEELLRDSSVLTSGLPRAATSLISQ